MAMRKKPWRSSVSKDAPCCFDAASGALQLLSCRLATGERAALYCSVDEGPRHALCRLTAEAPHAALANIFMPGVVFSCKGPGKIRFVGIIIPAPLRSLMVRRRRKRVPSESSTAHLAKKQEIRASALPSGHPASTTVADDPANTEHSAKQSEKVVAGSSKRCPEQPKLHKDSAMESRKPLERYKDIQWDARPAWMTKGIGVGTKIFGETKGDLVKPGMTQADLEAIERRKGQPLEGPDPFGEIFREAVGAEVVAPAQGSAACGQSHRQKRPLPEQGREFLKRKR